MDFVVAFAFFFISTSNADEDGDLRLVNGQHGTSGRLEIFHDGEWGTICDDSFGQQSANVACRQLGFDTGEAASSASFGQGTSRIWLDDVICSGKEVKLTSCQRRVWGDNNCGHHEDVGVMCYDISHIESLGNIIPTPSLFDRDINTCVFAASSTFNDIWLDLNFTHPWSVVELDITLTSDFAINCNVDMMVSYLFGGDGRCGEYRFCQSVDLIAEPNTCRFSCACGIGSCDWVNVRVPVGATQFSMCEIVPSIET